MNNSEKRSRWMLICSMCIFATIGILRRHIPYSSSLIALVRGVIGSVFLLIIILIRKQKFDRNAVRTNIGLLILSGAAIGFNWIFLFEAYCYTSVATATLCYYLAPILVIMMSPVVLKEKLTVKNCICAMVALAGMIPVSGVFETKLTGIQEIKGILFGLGAAALYGSVILMNKCMKPIPAYDKTVIQLSVAAAALIPYVVLTGELNNLTFDLTAILLLIVAGTVHTGFAYWLYFGSMVNLSSHSVAILSYIDPILAIILSAVLLGESMSISSVIGAVMILGAAYISEKN